MNHKKGFNLLLILIWLALANINIAAQQTSPNNPCRPVGPEDTANTPPEIRAVPYCSPKKPIGCEIANVYTDFAAYRTRTSDNSNLIVIARLGNGEKSRHLNLSRLRVVRNFLSNNRGIKRIVTAEGERIKGYGQLEFYVEGKLLFTLPIRRNKNIDLGSCNAV